MAGQNRRVHRCNSQRCQDARVEHCGFGGLGENNGLLDAAGCNEACRIWILAHALLHLMLEFLHYFLFGYRGQHDDRDGQADELADTKHGFGAVNRAVEVLVGQYEIGPSIAPQVLDQRTGETRGGNHIRPPGTQQLGQAVEDGFIVFENHDAMTGNGLYGRFRNELDVAAPRRPRV